MSVTITVVDPNNPNPPPVDPGGPEDTGYKRTLADDRCIPLRIGNTNFVPDATLTASPDPVTPLDAIKNEYRSRTARWTNTDFRGEVSVSGTFAKDESIEYIALPGARLPGVSEIKLELFDAAGDPVEGYQSGFETLASLIPAGEFRAGIDPFGGIGTSTTPEVFVLWMDEPVVARSFRLRIQANSGAPALVDIRIRMLLMGGKFELTENFVYGGVISYLSEPNLVRTASNSYVQARAQRRGRRMRLPIENMTDYDRSRLSDMETELLGKPFIVSAHPGREARFQYRDYNFLARFAEPLAYTHSFEDIHAINNLIFVEV